MTSPHTSMPPAVAAGKRSPRRVAVLGASGFVGGAVVKALADQGDLAVPIRAPRLSVQSSDVSLEVAARDDVVALLAAELSGCDAVVNAAGVPDASSTDALDLLAANAVLVGMCAKACSVAGVPRFVQVSSAVVQGNAPTLDESDAVLAFSAYSKSKIAGEVVASLHNPGELVIYRPPSVHAPDRRITGALARIARSPLASVVQPVDSPTPQALLDNVAAAVAYLTREEAPVGVVIHPWEGLTTHSLLTYLGARRIRVLPRAVARTVISAVRFAGHGYAPLGPHARRLEMLWFGQAQAPSALTAAGWTPPVGPEGWSALGQAVRRPSGAARPRLSPQAKVGRRARDESSVVYAVTVPSVAYSFLRGQLAYLRGRGWAVTLACSPGRGLDAVREREGVEVVELATARDIDVARDLRALVQWILLLRRVRPMVLNASTPKAALLALLAGRLTRVPVRIYLVRGLRLESESGLRRKVLTMMERISSWSATHVVAVSPSLSDELCKLRLTAGHVPIVIASGSSNGVDCERVARGVAAVDRQAQRRSLGVADDAYVVAFVGRVRRDKGVHELCAAMRHPELSTAVLVTQGDVEDDQAEAALSTLGERHIHLGWRDDIYEILALADVLALPTHREGFPNVVLEAAAASLPVVTTTATGAIDSVQDGVTGLVVPTGDAEALAQALSRLALDPTARRRMGAQAEVRARQEFSGEVIWEALEDLYCQAGATRPRGVTPALHEAVDR
ncbi:glycosyltransferase [Pedococcus bigeumensis]|uniref:D-inositol 3-phosphate glycosyltransferase n=1 Tax=Pedococcus bigeumensis TaxID=433644 RepID=A0A502CW54_9MICO|nr:glycosyltransferase [Pedococcus bigeumensis]TPG16056.1 glycosyltransferase [Pedococcus bigeumensis]